MSYFLDVDTGYGRAVITKELGWMEYSRSLAIASGLLHRHPELEIVIQNGGPGQSDLEILGYWKKGNKL